MKKRIIYDDTHIDFDEWKKELIYVREDNQMSTDVTDNEVWEFIYEMLAIHKEDEMDNLNVLTEGPIIAIADLGLWNGRVQGYRIFGSSTVNDIFKVSEDYNEYYSDGRDIRATCVHHDGTNHILYRVMRKNRNPDQLLYNLYHGKEITRKQLNYYTKSLHPYVAKVYGW